MAGRRKTIGASSSNKDKAASGVSAPQEEEIPSTSRGQARRNKKTKQQIDDVFGDFFGFGPNPPGCMKKDGPPTNFKLEKEKFMKALKDEVKSYDLETIKTDLHAKIDQIVVGIKKEERNIITDEDRQLRNLDKLNYMQQYLKEDNVSTRQSLSEA